MARSTFVYVTYIRTTPEKLWTALTTDAALQRQYWFGCHCASEWVTGAPWKLINGDGVVMDAGEIVEANRPHKLVIRWAHQHKPELAAEGPSVCTMELVQDVGAVKLSIHHTIERDESKLVGAVGGGWPKVLSNLKSLLETGAIALGEPYGKQTTNA